MGMETLQWERSVHFSMLKSFNLLYAAFGFRRYWAFALVSVLAVAWIRRPALPTSGEPPQRHRVPGSLTLFLSLLPVHPHTPRHLSFRGFIPTHNVRGSLKATEAVPVGNQQHCTSKTARSPKTKFTRSRDPGRRPTSKTDAKGDKL
jgi:hypothetical protein